MTVKLNLPSPGAQLNRRMTEMAMRSKMRRNLGLRVHVETPQWADKLVIRKVASRPSAAASIYFDDICCWVMGELFSLNRSFKAFFFSLNRSFEVFFNYSNNALYESCNGEVDIGFFQFLEKMPLLLSNTIGFAQR